MHLIQDHRVRMQAVELLWLQHGKFGVGHEGDIARQLSASSAETFTLSFEDVFRGREPQHRLAGMILAILKAYKALASSGWMDNTATVLHLQHIQQSLIGFLIRRLKAGQSEEVFEILSSILK